MIDTLKIISRSQIISFETFSDEHVFKLTHEMDREGKLRNPLLVYPLFDKYLLLDDACILQALEALGINHIPVQVADEDTFSVHPWQRVVENWHKEDLLQFCRKFPRQLIVIEDFTEPLKSDMVEIRFKEDNPVRISFKSNAIMTRVDLFNKLCGEVMRGNQSFRANLSLYDTEPFEQFEKATAVIYPPVFTIDELAHIGVNDMPMVQGIVRIDQPGRVLGVDYSLSILKEEAAPEEKESFFRQLIKMRISSDRTAYYYGNVFMFNN
ncbi:MAG: hypothetical protein KAR42_01885 [candidate division Zixibacteria bacterium]|nr:hypothetical protein [candidate division Zixibacteria bacterium]